MSSSHKGLSAAEIGGVVEELAADWQGSFIQKVHMRGRQTLMLSLRKPGQSGVLLCSVDPKGAHLCLLEARPPADPKASAFCMLLRKCFKGTKLLEIRQVDGDRVVALTGPRATLFVELTGQRGGFVLADAKGLTVRSTLFPGGPPRAGLAKKRAYAPPERTNAEQLPASSTASTTTNAQVAERFWSAPKPPSLSDNRCREALKILRRRLKKARKALSKVAEDQKRLGTKDEWVLRGELLKMHLSELQPGWCSVELENIFTDGKLCTIPLDPALPPAANMERCFKKARKAARAQGHIGRRLEELRAQAQRIEDLIEIIGQSEEATLGGTPTDSEDLKRALAEVFPEQPAFEKKKSGPARRSPYKKFADARGRPILVGRSAADNDRLTLDVARPADLWLHAKGRRGSHVVVRLTKGEDVDSQRLIDAATLAAHFSEARKERAVEITYTPRRYVRKGKGCAPGQVILLREKVLLLKMEPARLARLLATHQG